MKNRKERKRKLKYNNNIANNYEIANYYPEKLQRFKKKDERGV